MIDMESRPVAPVRPVAGYVGGKKQLAASVIEVIETIPHQTYAEPFVGMGGVFLRRRRAPKVEVINDISKDVSGLFRVLQRHYQAFMDMLKWQLASRADFERPMKQDPDMLTDLERAARFLFLQRMAFGGKVIGRTFGFAHSHSARFDITKLATILEDVHDRLAGVYIECLPWSDFIARWDREATLFYLDPPYLGTEHFYGRGVFHREDHERLAEQMKSINGKFVLTLNDHPHVRSIYHWAIISGADVT